MNTTPPSPPARPSHGEERRAAAIQLNLRRALRAHAFSPFSSLSRSSRSLRSPRAPSRSRSRSKTSASPIPRSPAPPSPPRCATRVTPPNTCSNSRRPLPAPSGRQPRRRCRKPSPPRSPTTPSLPSSTTSSHSTASKIRPRRRLLLPPNPPSRPDRRPAARGDMTALCGIRRGLEPRPGCRALGRRLGALPAATRPFPLRRSRCRVARRNSSPQLRRRGESARRCHRESGGSNSPSPPPETRAHLRFLA